ncbi:hypothetical protein T459_15748 [Capsicum annuum]|uniref:Uncharacterized protein n=1 Tax=Capsicum annuum TaxID=4072 RepID=A0A2G2Z6R5_CAPAN|nr:hypothetical protein T459_15748 [Capsicum annuum]
MLNHLRFLSIGIEVKSLPSSFSNLWNLETLHVNNKVSTLVLLLSIWDLAKLRVLYMTSCSFLDMDTDEPILIAEHSKLENLRDLRTLVLSYSKETEDIFIRFPNLQRLTFVLKESWDYSKERYWFPKLDFLTELEELRVDFKSSNTNDSGLPLATNWSWDFHFPSNLKILLLSDFPMTSGSLSTIARLLNLEELFLTRTIIQGEEWNMGEEDKLCESQIFEFGWKIPPNFGDFGSLKIIKLVKSPQLEDSALEIKQSVEDMTGEDKLQILGSNNIPLSKTEVSFILSLSISRTLPCFPELFRHAQFTPPSWRAAAMPRTVSLLLPNASDFNCGTFKSIKYRIGELNEEKFVI